jgi:cyclophilin family peptidyl-prolyl cis-trans isomerase
MHTRSAVPPVALLLLLSIGCATAPPPRTAPVVPYERKMATILQLEDQRILRIEPPPPPPVPAKGRAPAAPPPAPAMDLTALLTDPEGRVRRRAALAIGRVGLREGVAPVSALLTDTDPEVRQMAAFALGLIGDASASTALTQALSDAAPLVRGRAAEALGQIGAKDAAVAIGAVAREYAVHPAVTSKTPDDERWPAEPEADAFKLALFALVRLGAYEPLAAAVLEGDRPRATWWPVAYALQRINDPRTAPALRQLLATPGKYTPSFAARGLGASKDASAAALLIPLLDGKRPLEVTVSAIRAVAQLRAAAASDALTRLAGGPATDPNIRLEAVTALGTLQSVDALPVVQDLMTDRWPVMRIAATRAAAAIDPEIFRIVLATLEPDRDWTVRAALASVIATLEPELALERLPEMLKDEDKRVWPAVLRALMRVKAPQLPAMLMERLKEPDFVVRATVSELIGQLKLEGGAAALREAYKTALPDAAHDARAAALAAIVQYGAADATPLLTEALADKDWAVRVRAVELLTRLEPASDVRATIRPAPGGSAYDDPALIGPPYSPHVYIETAKGTIEFELAVLDAPQTSRNFITLARKGFFNGLPIHRVVPNFVVQDGDPRGDGQGGPGYTIRDELNERPFLRATVGMALSWEDTGGSQFFIVHSPAPHLDARYTAFGHVVNGMEVVDRIQQGDLIERIRVWDGEKW